MVTGFFGKLTFSGWWVLAMLAVLVVGLLPSGVLRLQRLRLEALYAPANFMQVESVSVGNSAVGEPTVLSVKRTILRDFQGRYVVTVRTFPESEVVCAASALLHYDAEATLPNPVTLHWWANDGKCDGSRLAAGDYTINTTWTILNDDPRVADQMIVVDSNPFTKTPLSPSVVENTLQKTRGLQQQLQGLTEQVQQLEEEIKK